MMRHDGFLVVQLLLMTVLIFVSCEPPSNKELIQASARDDIAQVQSLLAKGANVNSRDSSGVSPLMISVIRANSELTAILISNGADINAKSNDSSNVLMYAVATGNTAIVESLIAKGADINAKNRRGETSLMFAAQGCREDIARILLQGGASIDAQDEFGITALMITAQKGCDGIFWDLIERGANPNLTLNENAGELLSLLTGGTSLRFTDNASGRTALMLAAEANNATAVSALMNLGVGVNKEDNNGKTALMLAAERGNVQIVTMLLLRNRAIAGGLPTRRIGSYWISPNDLAASLPESASADVNRKSESGETALMLATRNGHYEIAKLLRRAGATE